MNTTIPSNPKNLSVLAALTGLALAFAATPAHAEIAIVRSTNCFPDSARSGFATANLGTVGSVTFDGTGVEKLVVAIGVESQFNNQSATVTGVKFNNVALTQAVQENARTNTSYDGGTAAIFYLNNPLQGTAAFSFTWTTTGGQLNGGRVSIIGLSGTAPGMGNTNKNWYTQAAAGNVSTTLTTSADNSWVIAMVENSGRNSGAGTPSVVSPLTLIHNGNWGSQYGSIATGRQAVPTSGTTITPTFTTNAGGNIHVVAVEFKVPAVPAILLADTLGAVDTTYGTASATPTSFHVSGANLTGAPGNLTVAPPTGYEVSLSSGSDYTTSLSVPYSTATLSATQVFVRLAASAGVAGSPYSGDISVSGGGVASPATIATVSSTVTAKDLTVTATGPLKPFGTALTAGTSTTDFTATGLVNGETVTGVTLTPDAAGLSDTTPLADPYVVTPSDATGAGGFLTGNYVITYNPYIGTVGASLLAVSNSPVIYNGSPQAAVVTNPVAGIVSNVKYEGSSTIPTNAGTYVVTADFAPNDTVTYLTLTGAAAGNFVIQPQQLTVDPPTIAAKDYDASPTAGAVTVGTLTGLIGTETVTATGLAANYSSANVGTYNAVVVTYTLADGTGLASNYSLANGTGTGVINKLPLSITAPTIAAKAYDASPTAGAVTVGTLSGFVGSETVTATGTAAAYPSANAGSYTEIVVTYTLANGTNGGLAANYSLAAGTADGVINPKALTVTATGPSKTYGTALTDGPSTTNFTATGLATGETVTSVTLTPDSAGLAANTSAGVSYVVTPSLPTGSFVESNYAITYVPYNGTVAKKPLSITSPTIAAKPYDTTSTAGTLTVGTLTGFVDPETVTVIGAAANYTSANAGTYNSVVVTYTLQDGTNGGLAANYSLANGSATGVINKVALSITAPTIAAKPYDTTATAGAVTVGELSGFVGSETVTASGTAAAYTSANVGSYPDTVVTYTLGNGTNGGLAVNYSLANGAATGVINKADQTISFTLASPVLLSAGTVSLSATSTSGLTVIFSSSNSSIANVSGNTLNLNKGGTITVTASQEGNSNYNAATEVPQSLIITDDSAPPAFAILRVVSAAAYNSGTDTTSVTLEFTGEPGMTYQIAYSTNLMSWSTPSDHPTGTGTFQVTITSPGDVAAAWATKLFFRANR